MLIEIFDHLELCTDVEVERMLPLVSEQRRAEALRYKHTFGRFCCLKSYLMLCELLGAVSPTLDYTLPEFAYNEYGKPFLKERPDIHFSISHTKNAIAVAIASKPIGIDIEQILHHSEGVLKKTMNPSELQTILESANPDESFTALWTQKEAVLKLLGTGIQGEMQDVLSLPAQTKTHIRSDVGYAYSIAEFLNEE